MPLPHNHTCATGCARVLANQTVCHGLCLCSFQSAAHSVPIFHRACHRRSVAHRMIVPRCVAQPFCRTSHDRHVERRMTVPLHAARPLTAVFRRRWS
jgi:hypothetical protein